VRLLVKVRVRVSEIAFESESGSECESVIACKESESVSE
jgi:hypothetical protein